VTILILGGAGFIGHHVAAEAAAEGHETVVVHRGRSGTARLPGILHARADRRDAAAIREIVKAHRVRTVIDMIAMEEADTVPLLAALAGVVDRYVLISSIDVYQRFGAFRRREADDPDGSPLDEAAPLRRSRYIYRRDPYAPPGDRLFDRYDKIPVEELVRSQRDFAWTILRLPFIYGPGDHQRRFDGFVARIADRRPFLPISAMRAAWRGTFDHVENAAAAIALAAVRDEAAGEVFNLGETDALSQREWIHALAGIMDGATEIVEFAEDGAPAHLTAFERKFDPSIPVIIDARLLRARLPYAERVSRQEGLRRMIEACLRNRPRRQLRREYAEEDRFLERRFGVRRPGFMRRAWQRFTGRGRA
jgi:nucleoside-diphosphate-sugar epimerase